MHGSDSTESVVAEAKFFFPRLDLAELAEHLQTLPDYVAYDEDSGVHDVRFDERRRNVLLRENLDPGKRKFLDQQCRFFAS